MNTQTETNAVEPVTKKIKKLHRVMIKFMEKCPDMDLTLNEQSKFINTTTNYAYQAFKLGWMSHPSFSEDHVFVLAKQTAKGITFSESPRVHQTIRKAKEQKGILEQKHNGIFHIFHATVKGTNLRALVQANYPKKGDGNNTQALLEYHEIADLILNDSKNSAVHDIAFAMRVQNALISKANNKVIEKVV